MNVKTLTGKKVHKMRHTPVTWCGHELHEFTEAKEPMTCKVCLNAVYDDAPYQEHQQAYFRTLKV